MARTNNFDALRLMGALMVLAGHMAPISGRTEWRWMVYGAGSIGVLIFFSISGYLITASWRADADLGRFLVKRYLRVLPGLAVATVSMYSIILALGLRDFPANALHHFNLSLWTIPYEVYCYILLAGAGMLLPRPALACGIAAVLAYSVLRSSPMTFFALFFAGGALMQEYPQLRGWRVVGLLVAAGVFIMLTTGDDAVTLALIIPAVTVWIGRQSWPLLREAGSYGDLSYGIYIYAWPVQQMVTHYMGKDASYLALFAMSLIITTGLAWASWRYVEAPALRRKPTKQANPVHSLVPVLAEIASEAPTVRP